MKVEELRREYDALIDSWYSCTIFHSNSEMIFGHRSYKQLLALGHQITPFVIEDLKKKPEDWMLIHLLDDLFPGLMEYKGFVPAPDAARFWIETYEMLIKPKLDEGGFIDVGEREISDVEDDCRRFYSTSQMIADRITAAFNAQDIDVYALAEKMDEPPMRVFDYVSGRHNFHLDTLLKLEKYLGISLLDLTISEQEDK